MNRGMARLVMILDLLAVATSLLDPDRALPRGAILIATHTVTSVVMTQDVVATAGPTLQTAITVLPGSHLTVVARMMVVTPKLFVSSLLLLV